MNIKESWKLHKRDLLKYAISISLVMHAAFFFAWEYWGFNAKTTLPQQPPIKVRPLIEKPPPKIAQKPKPRQPVSAEKASNQKNAPISPKPLKPNSQQSESTESINPATPEKVLAHRNLVPDAKPVKQTPVMEVASIAGRHRSLKAKSGEPVKVDRQKSPVKISTIKETTSANIPKPASLETTAARIKQASNARPVRPSRQSVEMRPVIAPAAFSKSESNAMARRSFNEAVQPKPLQSANETKTYKRAAYVKPIAMGNPGERGSVVKPLSPNSIIYSQSASLKASEAIPSAHSAKLKDPSLNPRRPTDLGGTPSQKIKSASLISSQPSAFKEKPIKLDPRSPSEDGYAKIKSNGSFSVSLVSHSGSLSGNNSLKSIQPQSASDGSTTSNPAVGVAASHSTNFSLAAIGPKTPPSMTGGASASGSRSAPLVTTGYRNAKDEIIGQVQVRGITSTLSETTGRTPSRIHSAAGSIHPPDANGTQPMRMASLRPEFFDEKPAQKTDSFTGLSSGEIAKIRKGFSHQVWEKIAHAKYYPRSARIRGFQGEPVVAFTLANDGRLLEINIAKASKYNVLDQAALKAVERASPFPQIPEPLKLRSMKFKLPISFVLE